MMQEVQEVTQVASLPFGVGKVGADRHLEGAEKVAYLAALGRHQHEVPKGLILPVDCMDDRPIVALADGTTDPTVLMNRRAYQLAGGLTLATTKAAVAANAALIRDAKSFTDAFVKVDEVLAELGYADTAHDGCGAEKFVQKSVTEPVDMNALLRTFKGLGAEVDTLRTPLGTLQRNKQARVAAGFYDSWDPAWRGDRVKAQHPGNFSSLQTADDEVSGHWASGLLIVKDGHVFAKNAFVAETGKQSFALTFGIADEIANQIGVSDEERGLISLAFKDDSLNVANQIVAKGLEVNA